MGKVLPTSVAHAVTKKVVAELPRLTAMTPALKAVKLERFKAALEKAARNKAVRAALRVNLLRPLSESTLPISARAEAIGPGGTPSFFDRVAKTWKGDASTRNAYKQLRDVATRLMTTGTAATRAIAANLSPHHFKAVRSIMRQPTLGSITFVEKKTYDAWEAIIAGLSAEEDLITHPQFQSHLPDVMANVRLRKGFPPELSGVEFELSPLIVRRVRAPNLTGRVGQAYVDVLVAFRGRRAGSTALVYFAPMRAQSKLDNARQFFTRLEDEVEIVGQLDTDNLRWGTGPIDLNGVRIPAKRIFQPEAGQRVLAATTRPLVSPEEIAAASALEDTGVIFMRHRHARRDYFAIARETLAAFGIRRKGK